MVDKEAASGPGEHGTLRERAVDDIRMLRDFCESMEYQLQFDDYQIFQTMEREGAVFMRFAQNCQSRENLAELDERVNTTDMGAERGGCDVLPSKTTMS